MSSKTDLLLAVRAGNLTRVRQVLDQGVAIDDSDDEPGLLVGMACFLGHVPIVRELVSRGAVVDFPDNSVASSPLNMAIQGGNREAVRALLELGVELPEGLDCGLTPQEISLAQWVALRDGLSRDAVERQKQLEKTDIYEIVMDCDHSFDSDFPEPDGIHG
jgi:ankyrin repeat protein